MEISPGGDFVQIDGILNGDITVSKLNIGVSGSVNGVVKVIVLL